MYSTNNQSKKLDHFHFFFFFNYFDLTVEYILIDCIIIHFFLNNGISQVVEKHTLITQLPLTDFKTHYHLYLTPFIKSLF